MCQERLQVFLGKKPLYYKEIDHKRVHDAYALLKPHIKQPRTVHIVGTNGKGSTGRIVAHLAHTSGLSVGHYTSPHILRFNERIWIDGADGSDKVLEMVHERLCAILGAGVSEALSYFEYTTLLAFVVFENCDLMVLEAGLGGEFDATNVCDKALSIITPIGIDHQAFLGETIEEIAATKIQSIQKQALLAPQPYDEVVEVAKVIAKEKGAELFLATESEALAPLLFDPSFPSGAEASDSGRYTLHSIAHVKNWPDYLIDNARVAIEALDILNVDYDIDSLKDLELFGRFYPLTDTIHIDVGHNPLAAQAIVKALDKKVVLIYNSLDDKDYEQVLHILKPKVKRVEIIPIESQRATTLEEIEKAIKAAGLKYSFFQNEIDKNENYLVFGSFYTVEAFLRQQDMPPRGVIG